MAIYKAPEVTIEETPKINKEFVAHAKKHGKKESEIKNAIAKAWRDEREKRYRVGSDYAHSKDISDAVITAGACAILGIPTPIGIGLVATNLAATAAMDYQNYKKHGRAWKTEEFDNPDVDNYALNEAVGDLPGYDREDLQVVKKIKESVLYRKWKREKDELGLTEEEQMNLLIEACKNARKLKKKTKKKSNLPIAAYKKGKDGKAHLKGPKNGSKKVNDELDPSLEESTYSSAYMEDVTIDERINDLIMDQIVTEDYAFPQAKGYADKPQLSLKPGFIKPEKIPGYDAVIREYFDITDNNTRVILVAVDEEDQTEVLHSLTNKLYDTIVDKSAEVDYGDIPKSQGDIDAVPNMEKVEASVDLLQQIMIQYKQDTAPVDEIKTAIENVRMRRDIFKRGFMSGVQLVVFTYNTIVLAIVAATSFLIAGCIDFIKSPDGATFQASIDKIGYAKSKNHLLFNNLRDFNAICKDKSLDNALNDVIRTTGKRLIGTASLAGFGVAAAVIVVLLNILPILRELTYFFFYTRTRISDWFNMQADLLELSAENVRVNNIDTQGDRKTVIKRQMALADRFRSVADFFMVDAKKSEQAAQGEIRVEKKKYQADEVMDKVPDSAASALF